MKRRIRWMHVRPAARRSRRTRELLVSEIRTLDARTILPDVSLHDGPSLPTSMTTEQVATMAGVHRATVRRWIKAGLLQAWWSQRGRRWMVRRRDWWAMVRPILSANYREFGRRR